MRVGFLSLLTFLLTLPRTRDRKKRGGESSSVLLGFGSVGQSEPERERADDRGDGRTRSTAAVADHNLRSLAAGTILQFERKGFYIVDRAFDPATPDRPAELILIPDGKASSIALKYHVPTAAGADAAGEKGKGKAAKGAKTPAKDKDAAAQQQQQAKKKNQDGKAAEADRTGLPEVAPKEPVESILKSEGTKGYDIPVKVRLSFPPPPRSCTIGPASCSTRIMDLG